MSVTARVVSEDGADDDDRDCIPDGTTAGRGMSTPADADWRAWPLRAPGSPACRRPAAATSGIAPIDRHALRRVRPPWSSAPTSTRPDRPASTSSRYGYLTRVEGASDSDLFAAPEQDETTALLTAFASGDLSRRIHDGSVHSIDIEGTLTIYQRPVPGASLGRPDFVPGSVSRSPIRRSRCRTC